MQCRLPATFQCFELPQWVMEHLYLMYILDNFYTFLTHIHVLSLPSPGPPLLNSSFPQTATQPGWAKKIKHWSYFCHWKQLLQIPFLLFIRPLFLVDSNECCPAVLAMPSTSNAPSVFLPPLIPKARPSSQAVSVVEWKWAMSNSY